jgi:hypothetical protein
LFVSVSALYITAGFEFGRNSRPVANAMERNQFEELPILFGRPLGFANFGVQAAKPTLTALAVCAAIANEAGDGGPILEAKTVNGGQEALVLGG